MLKDKTEWEYRFAYSRIKRSGPLIESAGTIAFENGKVYAPENMYAQCIHIFEKLKNALQSVNAELEDVVRTKVYVTDISKAEEVGRAHSEFFKGIDPVMTLIGVDSLILPEALVEIELTAWKETK